MFAMYYNMMYDDYTSAPWAHDFYEVLCIMYYNIMYYVSIMYYNT